MLYNNINMGISVPLIKENVMSKYSVSLEKVVNALEVSMSEFFKF